MDRVRAQGTEPKTIILHIEVTEADAASIYEFADLHEFTENDSATQLLRIGIAYSAIAGTKADRSET